MKNISLALNTVLFLLVGILFYLHFSSKKQTATPQVIKSDGKNITVPQIAYIDIDSFQTHYDYFKTGKAKLEAKQKSMESELERSMSAFQAEYNSLVQKAQTMTEEEGMAAQQKLMEKQQKIEERKQSMEMQFMKETQDFNVELQERIVAYLKKYNANGAYTYILPYSKETINLLYVNDAYNITTDVLKGMNEEYASTKK
ncbi:MAG: OmpH family outer membrane protein [Chitinophagales bacterium]